MCVCECIVSGGTGGLFYLAIAGGRCVLCLKCSRWVFYSAGMSSDGEDGME